MKLGVILYSISINIFWWHPLWDRPKVLNLYFKGKIFCHGTPSGTDQNCQKRSNNNQNDFFYPYDTYSNLSNQKIEKNVRNNFFFQKTSCCTCWKITYLTENQCQKELEKGVELQNNSNLTPDESFLVYLTHTNENNLKKVLA